MAMPCPRCKAEGTVQLHKLSRATQRVMVGALGALMLGTWFDARREALYTMLIMVLALISVFGDRVACVNCGADLVQEVGGGWR